MFNRILTLSVFVLLSLSCNAEKDYEKVARDFLKSRCNFSISFLATVTRTEDCIVLSSKNARCFVIMADEKYDDVLDSPILAYSTESYIGPEKEKRVDEENILDYYRRVLRTLKADSVVYKPQDYMTGEKQLKTVVFGQQKFDMLVIGERGMRVAGCVPTSATQMMYYHKWPDYATGKYLFYSSEHGALYINVDGMHLNWPEDCSIYNGTTRRLVAPSRFIAINGFLFEANFGLERTSADMSFCKRSFVCHYGYSRKMVYTYNDDENKMLRVLRNEIDVDRPVMVGRWGHAFIIDGYKDDYFHFNLGWYGYRDGFYRLFPGIGRKAENDGWEMITGIMPERKTEFTQKTITLVKAGTLADHITAEDYDNLGKLKVVGPLNGKDICLLRNLSGGASIDVPIEKRGVLSELDLSETSIVASDDVYYENWEFSDESKSYQNCHEWNDSWQEEIIPHKAYLTKFHTKNNSFGTYMFFGCDGLENLVLPNSITTFGWSALYGCTCLRTITIPASVKYVKNNMFRKCKMLEEIRCSKDAMFIKVDTTATDTTVKHPFDGLYPYTSVTLY